MNGSVSAKDIAGHLEFLGSAIDQDDLEPLADYLAINLAGFADHRCRRLSHGSNTQQALPVVNATIASACCLSTRLSFSNCYYFGL